MSKSWRLRNTDGTTTFVPGEMDIAFVEGSIEETSGPAEVLDQRVRKCSSEVRGTNKFSPFWGSRYRSMLGIKVLDEGFAHDIAHMTQQMIENLAVSQTEVAQRIDLEPAEMIDSLAKVLVKVDESVIGASARIITQANTIDEILLPGVANALSNS